MKSKGFVFSLVYSAFLVLGCSKQDNSASAFAGVYSLDKFDDISVKDLGGVKYELEFLTPTALSSKKIVITTNFVFAKDITYQQFEWQDANLNEKVEGAFYLGLLDLYLTVGGQKMYKLYYKK